MLSERQSEAQFRKAGIDDLAVIVFRYERAATSRRDHPDSVTATKFAWHSQARRSHPLSLSQCVGDAGRFTLPEALEAMRRVDVAHGRRVDPCASL